MKYTKVKRIIDFTSSTLLVIIISPALLVLAGFTRASIGRPIFFKQTRSGINQQPFIIVKFRTMTNETDEKGNLLPDEMRITTFGKFMRSTSLDELPELFSIIKGDMSVIGPRPLPVEYNEYFRKEELDRFKVKGGLIPPDSLYGGMDLSWDNQLKCESEYANNISFSNDLKIFLGVFRTLLNREKANYGEICRAALSDERKHLEE